MLSDDADHGPQAVDPSLGMAAMAARDEREALAKAEASPRPNAAPRRLSNDILQAAIAGAQARLPLDAWAAEGVSETRAPQRR